MHIRLVPRGASPDSNAPRPANDSASSATALGSPRLVLIAFFAILLGSAALRFALLDQYPIGWHHDEALMGVMAQ